MIFRIDELKDTCNIILSAVDSTAGSVINETLELKVEDGKFVMCVTNREYYVKVKLTTAVDDENFHATVNANIFLKLISKITTDTVELKISNNNLVIVGNGNYKLPMIYDGTELLVLPTIDINNVTINFDIDGTILNSINKYNVKQLSMGTIMNPIQKMFYVDENGAITFTSGACVNKFSLKSPVRMLLNQKLVRMFSLFKGKQVAFSMGYDPISQEIIQTKVKFETDSVIITAILSFDDTLLNKFPATAVRNRAFNVYDHSVVINRNELVQTIERLMLFPSTFANKLYSKFVFGSDAVKIFDPSSQNSESIYYNNSSNINDDEPYETLIDLNDIKPTLDSFSEQYVTINFGNHQAVSLSIGDIYYVVPEVVE